MSIQHTKQPVYGNTNIIEFSPELILLRLLKTKFPSDVLTLPLPLPHPGKSNQDYMNTDLYQWLGV